ncbi:preprotein translocase subunit YajC [Nocardia sp. ET3-3]|uniref:Preprotein translocase subunit YajC n=1 Tax=Nocardia terrae TaxID=2675851 RepID=A0A7K1UTU3_9NOCA|nr:preprotein translocase subunit YajC [Nocardia terrae]MVU77777.1 preprotein translocase subunit YajC [Nocardia terrae]
MDLLLPLLLVALLIPMFLGVRRQKREMAKVTDMQNELKVGDRVVTTSGLFGTIVELDDDSVDLEIAEEVVTTWLRQSIREVRSDKDVSEDTTTEDTTTAETPAAEAVSDDHVEPAADDAPKLTKD